MRCMHYGIIINTAALIALSLMMIGVCRLCVVKSFVVLQFAHSVKEQLVL